MERLQKILASAGVGSRRRSEEMISAGEVTVNGRVARLGDKADPSSDIIVAAGRRILASTAPRRYLALNKPAGYVTSLRSTHGERTVTEFLGTAERLFPVGRLDKETSGLLFLTDDGDWANLVTHPRYGVEKEYVARVQGVPSAAILEELRAGIQLPGGEMTAPAKVTRIGDDGGDTRLRLTVVEGKKRQIRLMLGAVGHPVVELARVRIGPVRLGSLRPGTYRDLTDQEVETIRRDAQRDASRRSA